MAVRPRLASLARILCCAVGMGGGGLVVVEERSIGGLGGPKGILAVGGRRGPTGELWVGGRRAVEAIL